MPRTKHVLGSMEEVPAEYAPSVDETLGAYLHRVRLMRGLKLSEVARAISEPEPSRHASLLYLSQIEREQIPQPSDENLQTLAQVLQIKPEWLLEKARQPFQRQAHRIRVCSRTGEQRITPDDQELLRQIIDRVVSSRHSSRKEMPQATEDLPSENES